MVLRPSGPKHTCIASDVLVLCLVVTAAGGLRDEVAAEVMSAARELQQQHAGDVPGITLPAACVPCSAVSGMCRGLGAMLMLAVGCVCICSGQPLKRWPGARQLVTDR